MACAGIDFGNRNCVVAIARRGGIDICCNEVSNRATPSMVSFSGEERHIGESALNFVNQNFKNTCTDLKRLLGLPLDSPFAQAELSHLLYPVTKDEYGMTAASVHYAGLKSQDDAASSAMADDENDGRKLFSYQALVGMLLRQLADIASKENGAKVNDLVVSVPGWYTDAQRKALLDAARIADINVMKLMNEHAAVALSYGIFRTAELPEKDPYKVAFVDIGQSSSSVTIAGFLKTQAEIYSAAFDPTCGGRDFDQLLVDYFTEEFKKKYNIDPKSKPRPLLRLRTDCEKMKKVLSANAEAPLNLECFMEDLDVHSQLSRDQFEELMQPLIERLRGIFVKAIEDSKLDLSTLKAVEIIGGGTRIPAVKRLIEETFKAPLMTTINADECIARGCALQSAMLSPAFRVRDYNIIDISSYSIHIKKSFDSAPSDIEKLNILPKSTIIPATKALTFANKGSLTLEAQYGEDEQLAAILNPQICKFGIEVPAEEAAETKVRIKVKVDANGVMDVSSAQLSKEIIVEEPIKAEPKPEPKVETKAESGAELEPETETTTPAAEGMETDESKKDATAAPPPATEETSKVQEPQMKKTKKTTYVDLKISREGNYMSTERINRLIEEEAKMQSIDRYIKDKAEARNALESFVYDTRSRIDDYGDLKEYGPADLRAEFKSQLDQMEDWIYSDEGEEASKSVLTGKLSELKAILAPMVSRKHEAETREYRITALHETCNMYKGIAIPGAQFSHLSDEEKNTVLSAVEKAEIWCKNLVDQQKALGTEVDPVLKCADLERKIEEIKTLCDPIFKKPKPAPKKEEPKKEQPQENGMKQDTPGPNKGDEDKKEDVMDAEGPSEEKMEFESSPVENSADGTGAEAMETVE